MARTMLLQKCHDLKCYSIFVDQVRTEVAAGKTLHQAIVKAVKYCKEHDILADYFAKKEQEEVFDMVSFKWDWNRAMGVRAEEAAAKASAQTADAKTTEFVIRMLKKNYSCDEIVELAGTTKDNIIRIAQLNKLAYN